MGRFMPIVLARRARGQPGFPFRRGRVPASRSTSRGRARPSSSPARRSCGRSGTGRGSWPRARRGTRSRRGPWPSGSRRRCSRLHRSTPPRCSGSRRATPARRRSRWIGVRHLRPESQTSARATPPRRRATRARRRVRAPRCAPRGSGRGTGPTDRHASFESEAGGSRRCLYPCASSVHAPPGLCIPERSLRESMRGH